MLNMFSMLMLVVVTIFSYASGQYATAIVSGVCAGFVGGMLARRLIVQSGQREEVHDN